MVGAGVASGDTFVTFVTFVTFDGTGGVSVGVVVPPVPPSPLTAPPSPGEGLSSGATKLTCVEFQPPLRHITVTVALHVSFPDSRAVAVPLSSVVTLIDLPVLLSLQKAARKSSILPTSDWLQAHRSARSRSAM